jgi:hypothetical protein
VMSGPAASTARIVRGNETALTRFEPMLTCFE